MRASTGLVIDPYFSGTKSRWLPEHVEGARNTFDGSVFNGGAVVQSLRDALRAIRRSGEVQSLADSVPDNGGVMFVPAITGLGAPYRDVQARGAIVGLTRGSTVAHIARAAVESIALKSAALLQALANDGATVVEWRARWWCQRQQPVDAVSGRPAGYAGGAPGHG